MIRGQLKILPLGGTTSVQKNMYVYETKKDIVVFDCGIGFPDSEELGVDIVIPDFTYLLKRKNKVRGVVITHGHEDHRGALPYLLKEHKFKVFAVRFVKKLIEKTLSEYSELKDFKVSEFSSDRSLQLGDFKIHPYRVNHSIPDTLGFAVDTPAGRVFHNTDFKFDWTPVMDKPFDIRRASYLAGQKGEVLALLSDCLGSTTEGYTRSERHIKMAFNDILSESAGKQVFITTISSNISRIQQAIEASIEHGRKVVISGRSLENSMEVAKDVGYIDFPPNTFVDTRNAKRHDQSKLTYIMSGSYGQEGSGLYRVAYGEHKDIKLQDDAVVVFSADPIPTAMASVNKLINQLYVKGAEVYYNELQDNLHVSGHGGKGDQLLLANIVQPKYFIPIGGNTKHMRAYGHMMNAQGIEKERILQLDEGEAVIFEKNKVKKVDPIHLKTVYVDGNIVGDVGSVVLDDRTKIANHGIVVAIVIKGQEEKVEIVSRGFVFVGQSKEMIDGAKDLIKRMLKSSGENNGHREGTSLKNKIEKRLEDYFYSKTGRRPLIIVKVL